MSTSSKDSVSRIPTARLLSYAVGEGASSITMNGIAASFPRFDNSTCTARCADVFFDAVAGCRALE